MPISSKKDYREYLQEDYRRMGVSKMFLNDVAKFVKCLRKEEYYLNCKGFLHSIFKKIYSIKKYKMGVKLGFDIPCNVFEKGLCIHHYGFVAVNANAKIGKNCSLQQGVVIGDNGMGGFLF